MVIAILFLALVMIIGMAVHSIQLGESLEEIRDAIRDLKKGD